MSPSKIWSFISLASLCVLGQDLKPQKCEQAQKICNYYTKCAYKLSWMFRQCKISLAYDPIYNAITGPMAASCSSECVYAIGNLTSIKRGKNLETCDCGTDAVCLTVKSRMKKCVEMASGRYSTRGGCSEARQVCSNNEKCDEMQSDFLIKCNDLISGVSCTDKCKESQDKFLNSELGKALNECECDGIEEVHCRGIRAHYKILCGKSRMSAFGEPTRTLKTERRVWLQTNGQSKMTLPHSRMVVFAASIIHMVAIANVYR